MRANVCNSFLVLFFGFVGCCSTRTNTERTITLRDTVITVQPEIIERTLPAVHDTVAETGYEIRGRDTVTLVKYFPKERRFYLKVKPDSVYVQIRDTVRVDNRVEYGDSWWSHGETWVALGLIVVAVVAIARSLL